jgi:aspartate/methionine/tyrosine aminotransferase
MKFIENLLMTETLFCNEYSGLEENAIMIDSVSKRYMCGARIGCIKKNKELMGAAMKFAQARLSPPTFAQVASEAALDTPQSYFDEVISEYRELLRYTYNRQNATEGVAAPKAVTILMERNNGKSAAGFYYLLE